MLSDRAFTSHEGRGPFHFVLVPGLVPDGPETFLRQRALFQAFGRVSVLTFPYEAFPLDAVIGSIDARLREAHARGELPVLVGVSIGGGLCLEVVRRARAARQPIPLAGFALISPFTCTDDLAPLLRRMIEPILAAEGERDAVAALERGRSFFQLLATRSVPAAALPTGWRKGLSLLTPSGQRARAERAILARIERTLSSIPTRGAIARVASLKRLPGVAGTGGGPLATAPTLILWGSKERQTLSMEGPGTGVLCRPDLAHRLFPKVEIQWVYGADGDEVPHASLLKHAHAFNPHLTRFLRRLRAGAAERAATSERALAS